MSVTTLTITLIVLTSLSEIFMDLYLVNLTFFRIMHGMYYSEASESLQMNVKLLLALLPSLAMWLGMMSKIWFAKLL